MKKTMNSLIALSVLGLSSVASAARNNDDKCAPMPAATCCPDECSCCYCLGPNQVNPPVRPRTCDGDFAITVAGFYWIAHQDGMEYALENQVESPIADESIAEGIALEPLNNLINAEYKTPDFRWDFGFKLGLGYNSACDGWDFGVLWTWYQARATDHIEAESDDNRVLLPLWSAFASEVGSVVFASDIETHWKAEINLIDLELGREFWTSKYVSLRPHIGLRIAFIEQDYDIEHKGGSWTELVNSFNRESFNNKVDLDNDFKGVGLRAGLDSVWNLGCGFGIYGNFAAAIVYGRFSFDHDEDNRRATVNHDKTTILETDNSFRAGRAMLDMALGLQWTALFCDCQWAFTAMLGWEQHLFFHQNQLWRVMRLGDFRTSLPLPNNVGQNIFHERRGNLDTQGWTLTFKFEF